MASIQIKTPSVSQDIKTSLSQDYASGTTLNVNSSVAFTNGNYIVVGEPGLENTEVTNLTAAPGSNTTMTVTALNFSHPKGTPVYYTNWDKYSLEFRTSPSDVWTAYGGMPADLRWDALYTEYRDSGATSTYQWRYRYYSTEKSGYSDYSDTLGAAGWSRRSVGYMVREIRKIVNDPDSKTISDTEIIRFLNAAQDKIYSLYDRWWFLFTIGSRIATVASQKQYSLPSDFGRMHSVTFNYINGSSDVTYDLRYLPIIEFDYESKDNNSGDDDEIKYFSIYPSSTDNTTGDLYIWPKPATAGLYITPRYYKKFTDLSTFGDITEVPIPDILEDYAIAKILAIRKEDDKAKTYDGLYREQVELLKLMQRKQSGPPRFLWQYQGQKASSRLFGNRQTHSDSDTERYW